MIAFRRDCVASAGELRGPAGSPMTMYERYIKGTTERRSPNRALRSESTAMKLLPIAVGVIKFAIVVGCGAARKR